MKAMKTHAEMEAYCKDHEDCTSNKCMSHMGGHHKKSASSSTAAPAAKPAN